MALYNYLHDRFRSTWHNAKGGYGGNGFDAGRLVWTDFVRQPADQFPRDPGVFCDYLKRMVLNGAWGDVYDLLEYVDGETPMHLSQDAVNRILERDMAGYRLRDSIVIPITDETELAALDDAMHAPEPFAGARAHIVDALEKLSRRPEPDLRNAITEAVSAVESAARVVSGKRKATLSDALKALEASGSVHPTLKSAWSQLYGYTSDEDGLRHAMTEDPRIDFPTAKYMVVSCAAFVNLLSALPPVK